MGYTNGVNPSQLNYPSKEFEIAPNNDWACITAIIELFFKDLLSL